MAERNEVRVGLFVAAALLILGVGTILIVGFSPLSGPQTTYEVLMKTSSGIRRGDRVRMSGVAVGRVKKLVLRPGEEWPVLFRVALDEGVALTEGSSARITADGLLGAPYLEMLAGPPEGVPLAPGSRIEGREGTSLTEALEGLGNTTDRVPVLLEEVIELVGKINREIDPFLAGLQGVLSEENVGSISETLAVLRPTIEELRPGILALVTRLDELAARIEEGVGGVPALTDELTGLAGDLRAAVGPEGDRLAGVLGSAESTLSSAEGALWTLEANRGEVEAMLRDLRAAAANLRSLSQTLKERPALLMRYPRPPERERNEGEER